MTRTPYKPQHVTDTRPPLAPPLSGLRVLDFTQNLPGPYASLLLASMGAEVIKVEPPRGDTGRMLGRLFNTVNAGKKSAVLDLKSDAGRQQLDRLLPHVDVLLEGFRPGVMEALGGGPTHALSRNPGLVYCSMSGYGQAGPYRDYPGHDLNFQALTGVCHMMRDAADHPLGCALPIADLSSGLTAVATILAALYGRQRDGQGRHIDVALTDTVLSWAYIWAEGLTPSDARLSGVLRPMSRWLSTNANDNDNVPVAARPLLQRTARWLDQPSTVDKAEHLSERIKKTHAWRNLVRLRLHALPHYALYRTRDDRWISVGIVDEHKFWTALCEGLDLPLRRAIVAIPLPARLITSPPVRRLIARAFAQRSLDQWLRTFDRAKVPVAPVLPITEAIHDPHLATRIVDPQAHAAVPFPFATTTLGRAPRLGEHTEQLLSELPD